MVIAALLDAAVVIYDMRSSSGRVPLKGFIQGAKLVSFLSRGVLILSLVLGRSPRYFLSGLGALTLRRHDALPRLGSAPRDGHAETFAGQERSFVNSSI
jgi:hypothetical protein